MTTATLQTYTAEVYSVVWVSADGTRRDSIASYLGQPDEETLELLWCMAADECQTRDELAEFLAGHLVFETKTREMPYDNGDDDIPF
jgi:hypothetical protein